MSSGQQADISRSVVDVLRSKGRSRFALRMTPMIDMMFLLLIFFLVSAKFRPAEKVLPLQVSGERPVSAGAAEVIPLSVRLSAAPGGCLVNIGGAREVVIRESSAAADLAGLAESIGGVLESQKRTLADPVEIFCEPDVRWEYWARVYNVLFGLGMNDITIYKTESDGSSFEQ